MGYPTAAQRRKWEHLFNERAPIAKTFGMTLAYDDENLAVITLPYNPGLDHALDGVHGGIYMTLLDTAGWFTAALARDNDCWVATSEMSVHFLEPAQGAELKASARVIKRGKRQDIVEMWVRDEAGKTVGHATGTFVLLPGVPLQEKLGG